MKKLDITRAGELLIKHEGNKKVIYTCPAGYLTFGIGHMIKKGDPEYGKKEGTKVTEERIKEAFMQDFKTAMADCAKIHKDFDRLPPTVQIILSNMAFNLGINRFRKFKKMHKAVKQRDWKQAAMEMKNSLWYKQTKSRAEELVHMMENV